MLCSDPHLGFTLPSIWYAAHMSAEGRNIAGVTFAGSPSIVIGHNDHLGWGITNLQTDAVDYFVETVDENDPLKYKHRGEWKTMERISEEVPVMGEAPHKLDIDYTVHGPVISREGRVIAMQWTDLGVTTDALGIFGMNRATNFQEWLEAARQLVAALHQSRVCGCRRQHRALLCGLAAHPPARPGPRADGRRIRRQRLGRHDSKREDAARDQSR